MLSQKAIDEFREIYKREFKIQLSQTEATEKATNIFNMLKVLLTEPKDYKTSLDINKKE